tara:strand:- start:294 stop:563 length:270 start_codon:yes stop_codon:yes gene_type:complete
LQKEWVPTGNGQNSGFSCQGLASHIFKARVLSLSGILLPKGGNVLVRMKQDLHNFREVYGTKSQHTWSKGRLVSHFRRPNYSRKVAFSS